jgi:hypothetical protein
VAEMERRDPHGGSIWRSGRAALTTTVDGRPR